MEWSQTVATGQSQSKASDLGTHHWRQGGFSFVSVLLALLIAAALYFGYSAFHASSTERRTGLAAINATREVACRTNRQNIERDIALWSVNHPGETPSLAALEADGLRIPTCPEGGRYEIVGTHVQCSVHR
jgi:type II secretory pathway component PulJ